MKTIYPTDTKSIATVYLALLYLTGTEKRIVFAQAMLFSVKLADETYRNEVWQKAVELMRECYDENHAPADQLTVIRAEKKLMSILEPLWRSLYSRASGGIQLNIKN